MCWQLARCSLQVASFNQYCKTVSPSLGEGASLFERKPEVKTGPLQGNVSLSVSQSIHQTLDVLRNATARLNKDGETLCVLFPLSSIAKLLASSHPEPGSDVNSFGRTMLGIVAKCCG